MASVGCKRLIHKVLTYIGVLTPWWKHVHTTYTYLPIYLPESHMARKMSPLQQHRYTMRGSNFFEKTSGLPSGECILQVWPLFWHMYAIWILGVFWAGPPNVSYFCVNCLYFKNDFKLVWIDWPKPKRSFAVAQPSSLGVRSTLP